MPDAVISAKSSIFAIERWNIAIEVKSNGEAYTTGLERFRNLFHPSAIFVVGEKGVSPEVFLNMDLRKLFE